MNLEPTKGSSPVHFIRCSLHRYGCTNYFPQNQLSKHYAGEQHMKSIVKCICSEGLKHEDDLINLATIPSGTSEFLTSPAIIVNNYQRLIQRITDVIIETVPQSNPTDTTSNGLSNLDRIYTTADSLLRTVIEQRDRIPNDEFNRQLHQEELRLNASAMNHLSSLIASSSGDDHVNDHIEQNQDSPPNNEQHSAITSAILQIELDSKPVSTNGCLNWHIDKISEKLNDVTDTKKSTIDSPPFQTSSNGHRLWARLHLNGSTNPRFISLHVHLNFPFKYSFEGTIIFVLVDQSTNIPLQHEIRTCSGKMTNVNDRLGLDNFIERNLLHPAENRYVIDDSIRLLVYIKQTTEENLTNLPENVRDILMLAQQM